jgi:hypothetical protein
MSFNEAKVITWERYEAQGFPHFRSRGTASCWELAFDGDGWCLSQDGALLEWYGVLDVAMEWVGEEESKHADEADAIDRIMPDEGDQSSFHLGLVRAMEVLNDFLPPDCTDRIRSQLNRVRAEFEDYALPREARDDVAGLAAGMVEYCLFEAAESSALGEDGGPRGSL